MSATAMRAARRIRPEKLAIADEIRRKVDGSAYVILVNPSGLDSGRSADLRGRLRTAGARMQVVPNRIFRAAIGDRAAKLERALRGPTAMVVGSGDVAEVARVLVQYQRELKLENVLKLGAIGGQVLGPAELAEIANLPPRPVMLGMLAGVLAAPVRGLVTVLRETTAGIVRVLQAIADRKAS
ncbi:MAG: 50S ribosomal protein L10 [Kiritimatiellae bacterium]|nr:50S ribosomal protein L10 [Kiritimatiellia bacterium]